jgi:beta-galactosidase
MSQALAERLHRFVERGGVLLMTFRSAVVDDDVTVPEQEAPVWLQDLFGVKVEAYDVQEIERYGSMLDDPPGRIRIVDKALGRGAARVHTWYDLIALHGAKAMAVYAAGFYKGTPAIAARRHGRGYAVYVGCATESKLYEALFAYCAKLAGVAPLARVPAGVEVRERGVHAGVLRFYLNYTTRAVRVKCDPGFTDVLTGRRVPSVMKLPGYGVAVLHSLKKEGA